jgi:hypothetical protein
MTTVPLGLVTEPPGPRSRRHYVPSQQSCVRQHTFQRTLPSEAGSAQFVWNSSSGRSHETTIKHSGPLSNVAGAIHLTVNDKTIRPEANPVNQAKRDLDERSSYGLGRSCEQLSRNDAARDRPRDSRRRRYRRPFHAANKGPVDPSRPDGARFTFEDMQVDAQFAVEDVDGFLVLSCRTYGYATNRHRDYSADQVSFSSMSRSRPPCRGLAQRTDAERIDGEHGRLWNLGVGRIENKNFEGMRVYALKLLHPKG